MQNSRPTALEDPILTFRGVSKIYTTAKQEGGVQALLPVDLEVKKGEFIALVGPSGCGKSTLLNITAALLTPSTGSVSLRDEPLKEPHRQIGVMFQQPVLLPWRTVERNVLLPGEITGAVTDDLKTRMKRMLDVVGLSDFTSSYPHELSGGMQQRAALARTLTYEPEVLLMDEPFGALDEFTREAMNLELSRLVKASGITVLFVTHNIQEAVFLADRVVVMSPRPGRISGVIPVPFDHPRTIDLMREAEFTDLTFQVRSLLSGAES
jgi:NitT/TauT family transport system ATP-binding protein